MANLDDGFALLERHPTRVIWGLGTLFAIVYLASQTVAPGATGRIINGDAIQYYAYLRSLTFDGDVDFANDYRLLFETDGPDASANVWLTTETPTGRAPNMMSIGPAILWAPAFLLVGGVVALLRLLDLGVPLDGVAAPFKLAAGLASIVYATAGVALTHDLCRRLFPALPSLWATLTAWLATSAVYYTLVSPTYSHAAALFTVSLFCHTWLRTRGQQRLTRYAWLGALAGLVGLVRWQDVIVVILPMAELGHAVWRRDLRVSDLAARAASMAGVMMLALLPQALAWQAIYGQPILMPQGSGFMRWTDPAVGAVLFSLKRGVFVWTPAVLLAAAGARALIRRDRVVGWSAVAVVLVGLYVNAAVSDWWAGEAFGARRFVSYTGLLALGLAALFASSFWRARVRALRWVSLGLVTYNLLFVLQYQLFLRGFAELAAYPSTPRTVFVERLAVPWRLARYWLETLLA